VKILVTGGAGFIGSNFICHVLASEKRYAVVNYDKLTYAGNLANLDSVAAHPDYTFVRGDICDAPALEAAMRGCDAVVHFAAESHVDRSIYEPSPVIQTNITGTFLLWKPVASSRYLASSTSPRMKSTATSRQMDSSTKTLPCAPAARTRPQKLPLISSSCPRCGRFGLPAMITRSSNNYGPYQFPEKLLPLMITNPFQDKSLPIYGDGKQQRDWLHVEDNCRGILTVLENGRLDEVYNIGGLDATENLSLVQELLRLTGKPDTLRNSASLLPSHRKPSELSALSPRRTQGTPAGLKWL
jgi:dTDP-glucose 4,6-dehydratase